MIVKIEETKNGYLLDDNTYHTEFDTILKKYKNVSCIICNDKTAELIKRKFISKMWFKKPGVTVRKGLSYGEFYINGVF